MTFRTFYESELDRTHLDNFLSVRAREICGRTRLVLANNELVGKIR